MPEPPTPIKHPTAARGGRFARQGTNGTGNGNGAAPPPAEPPRRKPKLKKLRLAAILLGLAVLALISTVFGMLMAVASDLPTLDNKAEYRAAENSVLYASGPGCKEPGNESCQIAKLTGNLNRILVDQGEVSPHLKNAVIAIEDRRFYTHEGVDYTGIARALVQDVLKRRAAQGGSTITQQFVKNALAAQGNRSVFQKLRESALAYHLERKWSKEKILIQYLNTVYFGHGAYGIEAAVRTYFGDGDEPEEQRGAEPLSGVQYTPPELEVEEEDPNQREAIDVAPHEAALLAGMIASPSLYDPIENPVGAKQRRDLVLARMLEQKMLTRAQYEEAVAQSVPDEDEIDPPDIESEQPYFTSWMTEHLLHHYKAGEVFGGGLDVKTTIDPEIQAAAESAISGRLAGVGPDASLVAIENGTGKVRAMVGGSSFDARPFNLATNGHRQPGSAFKPFILVRALEDGIDPNSTWASQPKQLPFRGEKGPELFDVSNYEDSYLGSASLWSATATSDNSVFAELGMKVKPERVAETANEMGIKTSLSTNPAMLLGGLEEGVTPLEMAYAYSTIANDGVRVSSTLAPNSTGPVAIAKVVGGDHAEIDGENPEIVRERVFPKKVGQVTRDMLSLVVQSGTGKAAQVGDEFIWGKTGTTENYGDAWFVGANEELTVAIWVGYADKVQPMEYEHAGGPVAGGTFPAEIFADFMASWLDIDAVREAARGGDDEDDGSLPTAPATPFEVAPSDEAGPTETAPSDVAPEDGQGDAPPAEDAPAEEPPEPEPVPTPVPPRSRPDPAAQRRRRVRGRGPRGGRRLAAPLVVAAPAPARMRRRPGPGHVRAVRVAKAPRQIRSLRDPDALPDHDARLAGPGLALEQLDRPVDQRAGVEGQPDPERLCELARARAEVLEARRPAALAHLLDAVDRLERADQHRGPHPLLLRHRVQQGVDPVREVDVGAARRAEQGARARRDAREGVAGRFFHVVALGLDDAPRRGPVPYDAAEQVARHVVDGAGVEVAREPGAHPSASTWRAWASWSRTRGSAVPPSETFDSSHAPSSSSS